MRSDKLLICMAAVAFFNAGLDTPSYAADTTEILTGETSGTPGTVDVSLSAKSDKKPTADSLKSIKWREYLTEVLKLARDANKPVMVDAYTDWCGWCKKMDRETFSDPAVVELSSSFICLKVNPEEDELFSNKYTIKDFPTVIFLKPDGTELDRQVGFKTAEDFKKVMKTALEKHK